MQSLPKSVQYTNKQYPHASPRKNILRVSKRIKIRKTYSNHVYINFINITGDLSVRMSSEFYLQ